MMARGGMSGVHAAVWEHHLRRSGRLPERAEEDWGSGSRASPKGTFDERAAVVEVTESEEQQCSRSLRSGAQEADSGRSGKGAGSGRGRRFALGGVTRSSMFNRQLALKDVEPTEQTGLEEYELESFAEKYRLDKTWGKLLGARGQNCPNGNHKGRNRMHFGGYPQRPAGPVL